MTTSGCTLTNSASVGCRLPINSRELRVKRFAWVYALGWLLSDSLLIYLLLR